MNIDEIISSENLDLAIETDVKKLLSIIYKLYN